jgi:hypothetical protein
MMINLLSGLTPAHSRALKVCVTLHMGKSITLTFSEDEKKWSRSEEFNLLADIIIIKVNELSTQNSKNF